MEEAIHVGTVSVRITHTHTHRAHRLFASTVGHVKVSAQFDVPYEVLDYAGQPEYWMSHQFFLTTSNSIYVLIVSLREISMATFAEQFLYWAAYLASQRRPGSTATRLVVVATHKDSVDNSLVVEFKQLVDDLAATILPKLGLQIGYLTVSGAFFPHNLGT